MIKSKKYYIFFISILLQINNLKANEPFHIPQVTTFYKHQYHASNRNWSVAHGKDGYVYFGNAEGLLCYDGVDWQLYHLPSKAQIRSVYVSSNGLIYTGAAEEIGYWQRNSQGELFYTSLKDKIRDFSFHNQEIWRIFEPDKGSIVFQGFSCIFKYDGQDVAVIEPNSRLFLMNQCSEQIFGGTRKGEITELTKYGFTNVLTSQKLINKRIILVLPYSDNKKLIFTKDNGVWIWNKDDISKWDTDANTILTNSGVNCGEYKEGLYYIGTIHSGIFIINQQGKVLYNINSENYLQDNTINSINFDTEGRLWFSMTVGLGYADLKSPISFLIDTKRRIGAVHSAAYHKGYLYLATNKGVYYRPYSKNEILTDFKDFKPVAELSGLAWSLDKLDDQLLCGHNNGTFRLEGSKVIQISRIPGGKKFCKIWINKKEYLLQNSYSEIALYHKNNQGLWEFSNTIEGFSEPTAEIVVDHKNQIWVQHNRKSELYRLQLQQNLTDPYSYTVYQHRNGLPNDETSEVFSFSNQIVITSSEGVYTYDELKDSIVIFSHINKQLGEYKDAHKIFAIEKNKYWLVKDRSIALYEISKNSTNQLITYDFNEPFLSLVENHENIVKVDSIGTIICLENGIGILRNQDTNIKECVYKNENIVMKLQYEFKKDIVIKNILNDTEIHLPYNSLDAKLKVASLISPGKHYQLEYVINGDIDTIKTISDEPIITLSSLMDGENELIIRVKDVWGKISEPYRITIWLDKPLWAKPQFIVSLAILGFLMLIILFFRLKRNLRTYLYSNKSVVGKNDDDAKNINSAHIETSEPDHGESNFKATEALNNIRNKEVLEAIKSEVINQKEKLGIRYPDKYYNKIIDIINSNLNVEDDWKSFEEHFDKANNDFISRLKKEFRDLTPRDLRVCAYLKMNLTSKEIAPLLGISEKSVEVHRYRMRKKMNLPSDINLLDFMISY